MFLVFLYFRTQDLAVCVTDWQGVNWERYQETRQTICLQIFLPTEICFPYFQIVRENKYIFLQTLECTLYLSSTEIVKNLILKTYLKIELFFWKSIEISWFQILSIYEHFPNSGSGVQPMLSIYVLYQSITWDLKKLILNEYFNTKHINTSLTYHSLPHNHLV